MYLLLLSFFPLLSAYNRPADESMLLDLSPNEFKPVKVNTRSTFLNIDIPAGAKGKEATYNLNTFKWLTEQVYPELSQKRNPVNNFIYSAKDSILYDLNNNTVKLYKNSLILRLCMCEKPFVHNFAFSDIKANFMFHEDVIKIIPKILNKKGVLNIGGKIQTVYNFAKKSNPKVKKKSGKKIFPPNPSMNISKLKKII